MWFLHKKVILTKYNLHKRNWKGCTTCCFCDQEETIQHLFISCLIAKMIWRIVFMTFNIPSPLNITNMFGNWLKGMAKKDKGHISVGVCAILWAIWKVGNDFLFSKKIFPSFRLSLWLPPLDPYVILSTAGRRATSYGYWVQQTGNGSMGFLQPVCGWCADRRLTCWCRGAPSCCFFRWLIFVETLCDPWFCNNARR
jgi:hypothetical protein